MAEKEMQAHDMVRRRSWPRAVAMYDQILSQLPSSSISVLTNPANSSSTTTPITQTANISGIGTTAVAISRSQKDRQIACLLGRCECLLELTRYESCLADARSVLSLLADQSTECLASVSRARRWLVHALCKLKKYTEAEQIVSDWIGELSGQQSFADISKTLERYRSTIQMINGHKSTQKISYSRFEEEMSIHDTKLDHWATNNLPLDKFSKLLSNKGLKKRENAGNASSMNAGHHQHNGIGSGSSGSSSSSATSSNGSLNHNSSGGNGSLAVQKTADLLAAIKVTGCRQDENNANVTTCSYCAITFQTRNELRQHCQTESHQNVIMSDEGRDWKCRPPPRGFTLDSYGMCEAYSDFQTCHYGNQCVEAHGLDELNEWKDRFEYRRMRLQKACEKELYGKSYTEQILERWIQAPTPERIMCEKVENVEVKCEQELVTSISSKTSKREWLFVIKTFKSLKAVALLQDPHRNHFVIKSIRLSSASAEPLELKSNQEWVSSSRSQAEKEDKQRKSTGETLEHQVSIEFNTDIYGTFRQVICFDFGTEPLLVKNLCVDVVPVSDAEKIEEIKRDIINSSATRWDVANTNLVKFETTLGTHLTTEAYLSDLKHEKEMLERYPCPRAPTFTLTQSTILEKRLTQNNYRSRIHELLNVEEMARYEQIARYNVRTRLKVTSNYILTPAGMATSTAKYSLSGELFALLHLGKDISEDTSAGRLILSNCLSVYISAPEDSQTASKDKKRNVFEALIEDKGKNIIYLKLSAKCVVAMSLKADTDIDVDIQFQLNRLPYCEWHNAVDKITDFKIIFPDTEIDPNIPWTPKKQWSETCEPKLNAKQREAVNAITTSLSVKLPPILLIGPFGTGKTYTLAQAIKQLLTQPEAKILICTHSNSAADLYIKEYLHPWIEDGLEEATPLRVYYHKRWVATVNSVVQKYCITDGAGNFRRPSVEDIMKHRIVVVTLSISMELASLGLPKGYFTHIFLDEAAQAMECEAIMPLALANDGTRIVLAGDHMQMSPELFSAFAKERKLHISLLERLYDHYTPTFPCKILLCENYRAHEAIIKFTSELFYEQKLIASGKQPRHERFYPLTFFTTRGEDVQDKNSTAFYNNAEVYEVVERVSELRKKWPSAWGKINESSIGIMTPYADQVFRIRSELRKRRMGGISVERVLNVQGKQFRAVFLSTVRTRRTCTPLVNGAVPGAAASPSEDADFGFLSNSKLLNTAITRAQSLVAVVGDPVALCSIGRCRKVWERFIETCHENKSLFGITWSFLRSQLDGVELKRGYVLNPLAPEFIPRSLQPEAYIRDQAAMYFMGAAAAAAAANSLHHGGVPPVHHNAVAAGHMGGVPHGGHMQPQHAAALAAAMYNHHPAAYNMAASMMNQGNKAAGHNFPAGPGMHNMGMRPLGPPPVHQAPGGPQQAPPMGGQYNPRGPPPPGNMHMPGQQAPNAGTAQFSPYLPWQQTQPQQMRGNTGGFPPPAAQGPPGSQNPNISLWGPPPQSNPWTTLPNKPPPPPNAAGNVSGSAARQMPSLQQTTPGMRGSSVPLQPPPNQAQPQQQPPPPQLRANPSDLGYLAKKTMYSQQPQQPPPPHANFPGAYANGPPPTGAPQNQLQLLQNQQRPVGLPNGPISPMDPFMQQRAQTGAAVNPAMQGQPNNFFGAGNASGLKDKDIQFLNNVHMPLNIGNNMFPNPLLGTGVGAAAPNNKQQSPSNMRFPQPQDYAALLPPNFNIYEMAFESKETQYKWYLKLSETHGQEAANKFTEVLRQVRSMLHQHQQQQQQQQQMPPSKMPPQMPPQMNAGAGNQLMPRDLMVQAAGMPPLMGPHNHQVPQVPPNQQNRLNAGMPNAAANMHAFMNSSSAGLNAMPNTMMPPHNHSGSSAMAGSSTGMGNSVPDDLVDGNINFNQQIDMVFNCLINGNDMAQPILRDLLGMVGGSSSSASGVTATTDPLLNNLNGSDLLLASSASAGNMTASNAAGNKAFPGLTPGNGVGVPSAAAGNPSLQKQMSAHMYGMQQPPQQQHQQQQQHHLHQQQQQQQQQQQHAAANALNFMGGGLLNNKDMLLSGMATNSNLNAPANNASVPLYRRQAMAAMGGNNNNYNSNNPMAGGNSSSTADNILGAANTNDILAGLGSGNNLIEALLQTNNSGQQHHDQQQQHQNNMLFKMMFNTHNAAGGQQPKNNDLDMFMRGEHQHFGANTLDGIGGANNQYHNNLGGASVGNVGGVGGVGGGDGHRNTTYAAVLSQGPQQHGQQQGQHNFHADVVGNPAGVGGLGGGGDIDKDPFAAIRELGQGTNGFYNYFQ